jgi:ATP-dependent helicase/nuclease subunit B
LGRRTVRILCGPSGSGKTSRLLQRYQALARAGLGLACWLGPTHRAVEALRARLPGTCCLMPQLFTLDDFAAEIIRHEAPAARPLSRVQQRLLVEAVVADLHAGGEINHFGGVVDTRGFAEGIFRLLAELQRHEIDPARLADAGPGDNAVLNPRKVHECARIAGWYQRCVRSQHLLDPEARLGYARDLLRQGRRRPFAAVRAVFVDGFADFTPSQHAFLEALAETMEEVWLALPDDAVASVSGVPPRGELFARAWASLARLQVLLPEVEYLSSSPRSSPGARAEAQGLQPLGLTHLERQLFQPVHAVARSDNADGLALIEAPGMLGEVRLVARRIKTLLLQGTPADDVLVTTRDLPPYVDLLREVFDEYGIPVDVEGAEALTHNAAVTTLLRALRLADDDWPFAAVTALLRSNYFRPAWEETAGSPEMAGHAEVLLRLLGEPRDRGAYLEAVNRWADDPPPGLEDEQAEESKRARTHELAVRCRPFLERFFRAWDGAPNQAPLGEHVAWLQRLADDLGLARVAAEQPRDAAALARLLDEARRWVELDQLIHGERRRLPRREFHRRLTVLAGEAALARTPRGPGRVRILSAPLARHLDTPYLFILGLGEHGFPLLAAREPFFDEAERQEFKRAGLDFPILSERLPDEMLLFYQLVTRARRQLALSYPAVDGKGQALLPSSFLGAVLECFTPGTVPVERRRMLIEGYDRDMPLSPAEHRVQAARSFPETSLSRLPPALAANLADAARMAALRFQDRDHNPYDGLFRHPGAIAEVALQFGPERVFSPTALEDYVACPFRFFLKHVLRLEELEEPREEIEVTRRGQAFHRALSRLHGQLRADGVHQPVPEVEIHLLRRLEEAVNEYVARAPSPASKTLWRLEGQRLSRAGRRYHLHWQKFVAPWREVRALPEPTFFEVDFGLRTGEEQPAPPLVIRVDGVEVRVSGRIDRVDVATLEGGTECGFWIIDYKTGRSSHYTSSDLREYRRLQLTLYALAVEQVLLADRRARPLGLAYWLVSDGGPKVVLPVRDPLAWFKESNRWGEVREQLRRWVATLVGQIRQGAFPLRPRSELCAQTCEFCQICRIAQSRSVEKSWQLPLPVIT